MFKGMAAQLNKTVHYKSLGICGKRQRVVGSTKKFPKCTSSAKTVASGRVSPKQLVQPSQLRFNVSCLLQ